MALSIRLLHKGICHGRSGHHFQGINLSFNILRREAMSRYSAEGVIMELLRVTDNNEMQLEPSSSQMFILFQNEGPSKG